MSNIYLKVTVEKNCLKIYLQVQKQSPKVVFKKGALRNFEKFTGKHLCQSLFFNKVADLRSATLLKKSLWHRHFPMNFAKFLRRPFLQNTFGRLLLQVSFWRAPIHAGFIEFSNFSLQLKNQRCGGKTVCDFFIILILKRTMTFLSQRVHAFC